MANDAKGRSTAESLEMTPEEEKFRADLDQLLTAARQEYARPGKPWLDWDGLEREIAEYRGGVSSTSMAGAERESSEMTPVEEFRAQLDHLQRAAREEYLRAGDAPLDWDDLEREIAERRGGISEEVLTDAGRRRRKTHRAQPRRRR